MVAPNDPVFPEPTEEEAGAFLERILEITTNWETGLITPEDAMNLILEEAGKRLFRG